MLHNIIQCFLEGQEKIVTNLSGQGQLRGDWHSQPAPDLGVLKKLGGIFIKVTDQPVEVVISWIDGPDNLIHCLNAAAGGIDDFLQVAADFFAFGQIAFGAQARRRWVRLDTKSS